MSDFVQGRLLSTTQRVGHRAQGEHMLKVHQRNAVYARLLKGTIERYEAEYQRNFNRVQQNILSTYFKDFLPLRVTRPLFPNIPPPPWAKSCGATPSYHTNKSGVAPPRLSFIKLKSYEDKRRIQLDPTEYESWIRSLKQKNRVRPVSSGPV
ncbi:uncharacterized protein LOC121378863 [Gigantopelta aegis]|uniref:uncharacterized protein LOC121378863 n=1 Tax=Gigantopelta aegis TaxID=1735272 RepID=UPI001B888231|nr:uncharacterized protein LOC121378863 [Gigantopelta aegis]XP_041363150.1 uncharacterized protein LOC121378863 [Gigantopelta aegis]